MALSAKEVLEVASSAKPGSEDSKLYWRCRIMQERLYPAMPPEQGLSFLTDLQWEAVYTAAIAPDPV